VNCEFPKTETERTQCDTADSTADGLVEEAIDQGPLGGDSWRPPFREDWILGVAQAAEAGFEAGFGPCAEFVPAFVQGVDPTKAYTQEDYDASVLRAWNACGVYRPRVGDRLPAEGDRVGAFSDTLNRGTAAMFETCALSGEPGAPLCPGIASHLPTLIVKALGNGIAAGSGAAPSSSAGSPIDAEGLRDRAIAITGEAIAEDCDSIGDFFTDDNCGVFDEQQRPEIDATGGGFDKGALATAAYELALAYGYTEAEAQQVKQVVLNAAWV